MLDDPSHRWLLQQVGEAQDAAFAVEDLERRFLLVNRRFAEAVGLSEDEILGRTDLELGVPERLVRGAEAVRTPLLDLDGCPSALLVQSRVAGDATHLLEATRAELGRTRALTALSQLLASTADPKDDLDEVCRALLDAVDITRASVYFADADGVLQPHAAWRIGEGGPERGSVVPAALAAEAVCQWSYETGLTARIGKGEDDPRESARVHAARHELDIGGVCSAPILRGGRGVGALMASRTRDRPDFDDAAIEVFGAVANQLSMALERHALQTELHHQAHHDSLTLLPNRRRFEAELAGTLAEAARTGGSGAVLFLDLDGFKLVNDTLGHAVGDALLKRVAARLAGRLGRTDTLARMGGDEFAAVVRGPGASEHAVGIARRLADALNAPFDIDGARPKIGTSIGISRFPADAVDADELLRQADAAMYQAKHGGKGRILCFDRALASDARRRAELELELREALGRDQLRLVYQPQVSVAGGRVDGVEALLRWEHPTLGAVSPAEFVPIAERTGLINAIGDWVLEQALRQRAAWRGTALDGLRVGVNIAASQFVLDGFVERVLEALGRHGVEPAELELEVTESVVMNDVGAVVERLDALRSAGVRVAVDDFGTGYSSLAYLQDLPLDVLKIDRAFVVRLEDERAEHSLVNTIQLLASGLGLETVAEGVETEAQRARIVALGCDRIQGYLHSPPVAPDALAAAVRDIHARAGAAVARAA